MNVRILHGYKYVCPVAVASMIRELPKVCVARPYLDCIVHYNETLHLCNKFAEALNDDSLREPGVFLARVEDESDTDEE